VMEEAKATVRQLFAAYASDPALLPDEHRERAQRLGMRAIADYIAGMTDRFALKELERLAAAARR